MAIRLYISQNIYFVKINKTLEKTWFLLDLAAIV